MIARTNSLLNRTAQINKPCRQDYEAEPQLSESVIRLQANKTYLGRYYYLFMLLENSGARITEILNIKHSDINRRGQAYIKGLKGGANRLIENHESSQYLLKNKSMQIDPFATCNRFSAYRLLKNIGIGKVKKGNSVASVTHVFRDEYVKGLRELEMTDKERSKEIGHKSTKSTEYYGKD